MLGASARVEAEEVVDAAGEQGEQLEAKGRSWVVRVVGGLSRVYGYSTIGAGINVAFIMSYASLASTVLHVC